MGFSIPLQQFHVRRRLAGVKVQKTGEQPADLRMNAAEFDQIMRQAMGGSSVPAPSPGKAKPGAQRRKPPK